MSKTQPRKTTASTSKDLDNAKMSAQDPKIKAQLKTPGPAKQGSSNDFVLVNIWARQVLDWDHKPLKTPGAPSFGSFQQIYSKLCTGLKSQQGGCQAVLMDSTGQLSYARNTSGWADSETARQHSEETLFLQSGVESFNVKAILITIKPCYKDSIRQRYPGHECQAFFRDGRKLLLVVVHSAHSIHLLLTRLSSSLNRNLGGTRHQVHLASSRACRQPRR